MGLEQFLMRMYDEYRVTMNLAPFEDELPEVMAAVEEFLTSHENIA